MSKLNYFMLKFCADKFMHFAGGACVMAITNSWLMLGLVAVGKEVYDYMDFGLFSIQDVYASVVGGFFAFCAKWAWSLLPWTLI